MSAVDEILESSKCKDCEFLVSRVIIPIDYEEFNIDIDALKAEMEEAEGGPINEEIAIIHNTCSILNMDLGHLVIDCNKYKKIGVSNQTFFSDDRWKKS